MLCASGVVGGYCRFNNKYTLVCLNLDNYKYTLVYLNLDSVAILAQAICDQNNDFFFTYFLTYSATLGGSIGSNRLCAAMASSRAMRLRSYELMRWQPSLNAVLDWFVCSRA